MKKTLQLSKRLQRCADFVCPCKTVADIGTDHGYLPIWLLQAHVAQHAIAADINEGPLLRAKQNVQAHGMQAQVDLILSDGLAALPSGAAEEIVIAGMGGELILRILSGADWVCRESTHLVLQPMTTAPALREGLYNMGFTIDREEAVYDEKKIYSVLSARYTGPNTAALTPLQKVMGAIQPHTPDADRYAASVLHDLENRLRGLQHTAQDTTALCTLIQTIRTLYLGDCHDCTNDL